MQTEYDGLPLKRTWKIWWELIRPHTLTAAFVPVLLGTMIALLEDGVNWLLFAAMMIASILIQAATNLFNEYYDFKRGLDTEESRRHRRRDRPSWDDPQTNHELGPWHVCHRLDHWNLYLCRIVLVASCSRPRLHACRLSLYRRSPAHFIYTVRGTFFWIVHGLFDNPDRLFHSNR